MPDEPNILVVGSINMDMVLRADHMPAPGETVLGDGFATSPGGKGANQAVAAARLGARCAMIGRVGADAFGEQLVAALKAENVDCENVAVTEEAATGVAMVVVDAQGENAIVVAGEANAWLTPDDLFAAGEMFDAADVVLLQLELPLPTARAAITLARRHACISILDPAPAPRHMPEELYRVNIFTPNATEARALAGAAGGEERVDKQIALEFIARGAEAAVLKLGPRGSMVVLADGHFYKAPPYKVTVVDTTAAGDAFTAALGVAVGRGASLRDAAGFANAAGALACTQFGAQAAMPLAGEVKILMEDQPI